MIKVLLSQYQMTCEKNEMYPYSPSPPQLLVQNLPQRQCPEWNSRHMRPSQHCRYKTVQAGLTTMMIARHRTSEGVGMMNRIPASSSKGNEQGHSKGSTKILVNPQLRRRLR